MGADRAAAAETVSTGRKPSVGLREMLNAMRYTARSAGGWRMLPVYFGPWQTIYCWFRRFVRRLLFQTIHDRALLGCWTAKQQARRPAPRAGCLVA
ncbi:transposase [Sabulicella rubraurantiaca]|uniref:transposase n=1 Tax=Sabulicella rubraurantiaca TaxID=2811429 RepID=UPI001A974457|nr:transposase [Sabulicella rubraurantiaca]